ncbi:MAG: PAS domain S-box protein, partial [Methanomassiliicoccales archaeon]
ITKNKLMAELLQESEERYRVMFDSSPVGLLFIKGVVKDCNETGADLLGYDRSELMGKSFIDLWNDVQENGQKAGEAIRGLADVETDAMRIFTWTAKDRSGKKVVFDAQLKNVNFLGERHFLLSFTYTRVQAPTAQATSMSEETYKTLLNTTQDSVLVLDRELKVTFASPRAGDVFGYGKELAGRDVLEMADGADKETLSKDLDLLMKGDRPQANRYRFRKKDGSTMFSELGSNRIVNEDGSVEGLVCIFHDVSAVVIAEGQAIDANRNLSEVTELMRMEIEKRMTVLMAHLQLLQFRYQDDADREEVEMAISSAEEVVKALTIAKSYEIMEAEAHQWMSLANVVDAALEGVGTKKLRVSVDMDGYEVFGSAKLGNALGRLFEQSVRKERGSTYLSVRTKEDQGRLVIVMEDDGTPYSANDLERMFESDSVDAYMKTLRFSRDVLRSSGMEITAEKADHGLRFRLQVPPGRFKKND